MTRCRGPVSLITATGEPYLPHGTESARLAGAANVGTIEELEDGMGAVNGRA